MTEDDVYRASTQFQLWSFTRESLASLRATTNSNAADRVRSAIARKRAARRAATPDGQNGGTPIPEGEIDTLTVEEEQKLLHYICTRLFELANLYNLPTNVKATAVQYMKRFYLSNSLMTYDPKKIFPSALFLATKTENWTIPLASYVEKIPKCTVEDILAPEYIITQGLRFTFDVRHPHRGLRGGYMELLALAQGKGALPPVAERSAQEAQQEMARLPSASGSTGRVLSAEQLEHRLGEAFNKAKDILGSNAILSDAYFLYTPAQIWMASFLLADEPLTTFYLSTKFGSDATSTAFKAKIVATLRQCAEMMKDENMPLTESREELVRIDKKLFQCRNPDKVDLVGLNRAQKRDGAAEGAVSESAVKRRKLEREKSLKEGNDLFGPPIERK